MVAKRTKDQDGPFVADEVSPRIGRPGFAFGELRHFVTLTGITLGLPGLEAPHEVIDRLTIARELGLGFRGPQRMGPRISLDAFGG